MSKSSHGTSWICHRAKWAEGLTHLPALVMHIGAAELGYHMFFKLILTSRQWFHVEQTFKKNCRNQPVFIAEVLLKYIVSIFVVILSRER